MKNFEDLFAELTDKITHNDMNSSTVQAVQQGVHYLGKKIIEEAGEVWLAAEYQSQEELAEEISQLLYWLQTMMLCKGIQLEQVYKYL